MDNYKDLFTSSTPYLILFSTLGGCFVRYLNEYKKGIVLSIRFILIDMLISSFLGYLTFWFLYENTNFNMSLCAIATCIVGNLGSKVFDIVQFILFNKLGYKPNGENYDCQRNSK